MEINDDNGCCEITGGKNKLPTHTSTEIINKSKNPLSGRCGRQRSESGAITGGGRGNKGTKEERARKQAKKKNIQMPHTKIYSGMRRNRGEGISSG